MEPLEILTNINSRYQTAIAFHKESSDLFCFLGLPGFAALHEYQFISESKTSRELKKYIIENHNQVVLDEAPKEINILKPLVTSKNQSRLNITSRAAEEMVKQAFIAYQKWETYQKKENEDASKNLLSSGDVTDHIFVSILAEDASRELVKLNQIILDMKLTDFDHSHIADLQPALKSEYRDKLKTFFKTICKEDNKWI